MPEWYHPIMVRRPLLASILLVSALLGAFTLAGTAAAPTRVVAVGDVHGASRGVRDGPPADRPRRRQAPLDGRHGHARADWRHHGPRSAGSRDARLRDGAREAGGEGGRRVHPAARQPRGDERDGRSALRHARDLPDVRDQPLRGGPRQGVSGVRRVPLGSRRSRAQPPRAGGRGHPEEVDGRPSARLLRVPGCGRAERQVRPLDPSPSGHRADRRRPVRARRPESRAPVRERRGARREGPRRTRRVRRPVAGALAREDRSGDT